MSQGNSTGMSSLRSYGLVSDTPSAECHLNLARSLWPFRSVIDVDILSCGCGTDAVAKPAVPKTAYGSGGLGHSGAIPFGIACYTD